MGLFIFICGLLLGAALGYGVFYYRYEDTKSVDGLRGVATNATTENQRLVADLKEITEQNLLLKEKVTELLMKNGDLNSIVGELNRYYYYLKEGYAKATELVTMLKGVDPVVEEKIKKIMTTLEQPKASSTTGMMTPTVGHTQTQKKR